MKYIPSQMIVKSRFKDYAKTLSTKEYDRTIQLMERLIAENSDYTDKKNYGFLCNLLVSLALVQMYEESGRTRAESQKIVADAMYDYIKPQIAGMKKLSSYRCFVRVLKIFMPLRFKRTLGYGWKVEFPKVSAKEFKMVTHDCIFAQIFTKYGMSEMTAIFCKVDDILYGDLPKTAFEYTQQIGTGGEMCNYTFRRKL